MRRIVPSCVWREGGNEAQCTPVGMEVGRREDTRTYPPCTPGGHTTLRDIPYLPTPGIPRCTLPVRLTVPLHQWDPGVS